MQANWLWCLVCNEIHLSQHVESASARGFWSSLSMDESIGLPEFMGKRVSLAKAAGTRPSRADNFPVTP